MFSLKEAFSEGGIIALIFILVAIDMYVNAVSASESFWFYSLGMIWTVPIALIKMVSSGALIIAPLGALVALAFIALVKNTLGDAIWLAILAGSMVMALGV